MYKVFSLEIYIHYFLSKKKAWQHNVVRRACENDWFGSGYVLFIPMLLYLAFVGALRCMWWGAVQDGPHGGSSIIMSPWCEREIDRYWPGGGSSDGKVEWKKEVAHLTWDSYDVLLMLSFCARVQMHLFFFFFQNLYRLVQQGASILVGFHHWLSVGMSVGWLITARPWNLG